VLQDEASKSLRDDRQSGFDHSALTRVSRTTKKGNRTLPMRNRSGAGRTREPGLGIVAHVAPGWYLSRLDTAGPRHISVSAL
jgi:hypothetical protein